MEYKMYLAIVLLSVALVACDPVDPNQDLADELAKAVETMQYNDLNTGMWLYRILREEDRWDRWSVPDAVPREEYDFVRALAAFTADIFKSEMSYFWPHKTWAYKPGSGKLFTIDMKTQWSFRFEERLVERCKNIKNSVDVVVSKIKSREIAQKSPVDLKNYAKKAWPKVVEACDRILEKPEHFMELSYAVAEMNKLV